MNTAERDARILDIEQQIAALTEELSILRRARRAYWRDEVPKLVAEGKSFSEIALLLGHSKATIQRAYHAYQAELERATEQKHMVQNGVEFIEVLGLSVRTFNSLKRKGIYSISQLSQTVVSSDDWHLHIRNFGDVSKREVLRALAQYRDLAINAP